MAVRDTPSTYSADEAARIIETARASRDPIVCPRCGSKLTSLPPFPRGKYLVEELACPGCHRCVIVKHPAG